MAWRSGIGFPETGETSAPAKTVTFEELNGLHGSPGLDGLAAAAATGHRYGPAYEEFYNQVRSGRPRPADGLGVPGAVPTPAGPGS